MPTEQFDHAAALSQLIFNARKKFSFGLALAGSKSEYPVIESSKTVKPDKLEAIAKKAAGSPKSGCGTLDFSEGKVLFQFKEAPPANCQRQLKQYFSEFKISAKVMVILPGGAAVEDQSDEAGPVSSVTAPTEAKTGESKTGESKTGESRTGGLEQLQAEVKSLSKLLMAKIQGDPGLGPTVKKLLDGFSAATTGTPDPAQASRIAAALKSLAAATPGGGGEQKTAAARPTIGSHRGARAEEKDASTQSAPAPRQPIGSHRAAQPIGSHRADQPEAKTGPAQPEAKAGRAQQRQPIGSHRAPKGDAGPGQGAEDELVRAVAPLRTATGAWLKSVDQAGTEIKALQSAISEAAKGMPGLPKIEKAFAELKDHLDQLKRVLAVPLAKGISSKDPASATEARKEALDLAIQVEQVLNSDPILSRIDDNPFVKVSANAGLRAAIGEMHKALA